MTLRKPPGVRLRWLVRLACVGLGVAVPGSAATITVNTTADAVTDDGNCSLREAVRASNLDEVVDGCTAGSGQNDTIVVPAGTYVLTLVGNETAGLAGDLNLMQSVTIDGASAATTIIDGNHTDRIFSAGSGTVVLRNLTLQHGDPTFRGLVFESFGGAILASLADLTLDGCVLKDNTALSGGALYQLGTSLTMMGSQVLENVATQDGGGLYLEGASATIDSSTIAGNHAGTTSQGGGLVFHSGVNNITSSIARSTISGNTAQSGAGILNANRSTLALRNVTVSGNTATSAGGGIFQNFGDPLTINNATIAGNTGEGGGVYRGGGATVTIQNSIVADNQAVDTTPNDCAGNPMTSNGYNLVEVPGVCVFSGAGDRTGVDPLLGALANNGGTTLTREPGTTSPAINAGSPAAPGTGGAACEAQDQRGTSRPIAAACDCGAVETTNLDVTTTTTTPGSTSSTTSTTADASTTTTTTLPPSQCSALTDTTVRIKRFADPAGNEQILLKATLPLPAGVPITLDPTAVGMQVRIDDLGASTPVLDLAGSAAIPAGARGSGCGSKDGWKKLAYRNTSGAMQPPTCPPGSASGLRTATLTDRRKKAKGIRVVINIPKTSLAVPVGPLSVTLVLGGDAAAAAGACGVTTFAAGACAPAGKSWLCR
jgi:CSLREA domain-containing protein